ncbi:MAG: hypothetical protein ABIR60_08625 [Allosphingosinicella sp.]
MVDLDASPHTPELPAFVTCGPHVLERAAGDYPEELVYLANVQGFTLWLKSKNLLAGPWDWILVGPASSTPINFEGPFLRREDATDSLCAYLERSRLLEGPDAIDVEASPHDDSAADASDQPRPRASVADTSAAAVAAHIDVSPEYIRMALDLAIAGLVSARARVAPAPR